jgi:phospholipid-translocating ATPase
VNLVFTSLPVIFMGAFDQDVSADVAIKVPQLYMRGILRKDWTQFKFWMYMIDGLYQSAVCFFLPFLLYHRGGFVTDNGFDLNSTSEIGVFVAVGTVTIVNLYILMHQQHWDWLFMLIVTLSILTVWAWTGIYSQFQATPTFYNVASHVFGTASFWAVTFLMIVVCLLPRFAGNVIQKFYYPWDSDIIREQVHMGLFKELPTPDDKAEEVPSSLPSPPKRKGFLSSNSSASAKSRSSSPGKVEKQYSNDDEQPINYAPSVTQSQMTGRPASQSDADSNETAQGLGRGHHRRSTDHTERWHSHTSPMIPEIVERYEF